MLSKKNVLYAFLAYVLYRVYKWRQMSQFLAAQGFKSLAEPPANWFLKLLGGFYGAMRNYERIYTWKLENFQRHFAKGDTDLTYMFMPPVWQSVTGLNTVDPNLVKFILKDNFDNYLKSADTIETLSDLLGNGIFAINHGPFSADKGVQWALQRKTAAKVFTNNNFNKLMFDTFAEHALRVSEIIERKMNGQATGVVELQTLMFKYTLDSIGKIGFGVEIDSLSQESVPFAVAFDRAQMLSAYRFLNVGWNIPILGQLYEKEQEMKACIHTLDTFVFDIINRRKLEMKQNDQSKWTGDILSLFMAEKLGLSDQDLRDIVMSFSIAGRDTTACTLSFCLLLLAENPKWQAALRQEIQKKLDDREGEERILSAVEIAQLPILRGCILETLRLYPPVPVDLKAAAQDDTLPDGRKVKAGTKIVFEIFCMGRLEKYWEKANEFDPDRWNRMEKLPSAYEFPVFQAGPRVCLGENMAKFEASLLIAHLVDKFEFAIPVGHEPFQYAPGITLTVKNGLDLQVTKL